MKGYPACLSLVRVSYSPHSRMVFFCCSTLFCDSRPFFFAFKTFTWQQNCSCNLSGCGRLEARGQVRTRTHTLSLPWQSRSERLTIMLKHRFFSAFKSFLLISSCLIKEGFVIAFFCFRNLIDKNSRYYTNSYFMQTDIMKLWDIVFLFFLKRFRFFFIFCKNFGFSQNYYTNLKNCE